MLMTLFAKLVADIRLVATAIAEGVQMQRDYARRHPGAQDC